MKPRVLTLLVIDPFLVLLAACGREADLVQDATAAVTQVPATEPPLPPTTTHLPPTATFPPPAEAQVPLGETSAAPITLQAPIWVAEGGFAFRPPVAYAVDVVGDTAFVESEGAASAPGVGLTLAGGTLAAGETLSDLLRDFEQESRGEGAGTEQITIGNHHGLALPLLLEDGTGRVAALSDGQQVVLLFGTAGGAGSAQALAALFDAILPSITFSQPPDAGSGSEQSPPPDDAGGGTPAVGRACFGSGGRGISCLDEEGNWLAYTRADSPLGGDFVHAMRVCDRELYIAHSSGIDTFDGTTWRQYPAGWGYGSPSAVACDGRGGFWVSHFEGVSHYDGTAWTTYPASQLAHGEMATGLVEGVDVGADGTVWVVTANSVAAFDGADWTVYQQGQGFEKRYFFNDIAVDTLGRPWALHSGGLLLFDDAGWHAFANDQFYSAETLALDAENRVWLGTFSNGVYTFDGTSWNGSAAAEDALPSDHVRALTVDGNGRIWLATDWGIGVLAEGQWSTYRMDTAELVDNDFHAVAVAGGGPPLPPLAKKAPGSLHGVVLLDGEPLPGARVEICVQKLAFTFSGDTPCAGQPLSFATTSAADGAFSFSELPVGLYSLTVNLGDRWAQLTTELGIGTRQLLVEPGQDTDVGQLPFTSEE